MSFAHVQWCTLGQWRVVWWAASFSKWRCSRAFVLLLQLHAQLPMAKQTRIHDVLHAVFWLFMASSIPSSTSHTRTQGSESDAHGDSSLAALKRQYNPLLQAGAHADEDSCLQRHGHWGIWFPLRGPHAQHRV